MKELHLDVGNTRAKYRILDGAQQIVSGCCETGALPELVARHSIHKALISSVAESAVRMCLAHDFSEAGIKEIFWAESQAYFDGVENAYEDYCKLGVDRWLAIIAAYHKFRKACCVFDFGSAVTVDFIGDDGRHGGGYIVPGSALCLASLRQNTAALKPELVFSQSGCPGTDTETCIQNGIYLQQAGFVQAIFALLENEFIVVTGGGFMQLECLFKDKTYSHEPDLVLDGLQLVFAAESSSQACHGKVK